MALHIEVTGDLTAKECDALTALIAVLRMGADGSHKSYAPAAPVINNRVEVPEAKAEIPKPPEASAGASAVIPPPPATDTAPLASGEAAPLIDPTVEVERPTPPPVGEVDATGLPWDARIHASTKTQKADKTWTAKRNVSADLVTQVTAELRQNMAAAGTVTPPPPPADDGPVFTDPAQAFGAQPSTVPPPPTEGAVVPPPPTEGAVVPPPPATDAAPAATDNGMVEFARIMRVVVDKQKAGTMPTDMATTIVKQLGLTDMRGLAQRPDLIPAFEALLP